MSTTSPPTERVGRYQLLEPIGIGPSGAVSRAKVFGVAGFERQFAVKRFHAELTATAAMAAMLSAAARAYGSLEHPRIARMSEFGVAQGATFTAVEYVVGLDALRLVSEARLAGVTLAAGGALALVSQAARAVGYAHGRGLTHLGLAPTNVIVTADGDIKITDFGILSATLPTKPIDVARLAQRIPYLAPEQLANEATSAATDVFALGVLAYELVTGSRAFRGDSPQQVASAIMAGPPGEPPLPRPIVRVLQRCLARSPFERFPDARAMADALDAALRVAPVPGTRKDIGAQVKETLDRLAALNEGQMSGMVALHLGTGPIRKLDDDDLRRAAAAAPGDAPAYELGRPEPLTGEPSQPTRAPSGPTKTAGSDPNRAGSGPTKTPGSGPNRGQGSGPSSGPTKMPGSGPTPFVAQVPPLSGLGSNAPASTVPDLPRQPMTVPGLAPPPIPVPPGVSGPTTGPLAGPPGNSTLLGMGKQPPAIPTIKRPGTAGGGARPPAIPAIGRAPTRPGDPISIEPAGPSAQRSAAQDASIHTLDPDDLELDSPLADALDLDAIDDADADADADADTGTRTIKSAGRSESRADTVDPAHRPDSRAETVSPTGELGLDEPALDPFSRPTRDLARRPITEGDGSLDGSPDDSGDRQPTQPVAPLALALDEPLLGRTETLTDPLGGRTILGMAASPARTASATPSAGTRKLAPPDRPGQRPADPPPGDELAAMALEELRAAAAAAAAAATDEPAREPSTPTQPPAREPSQPIAPPIQKTPMPPGWVNAPISNAALATPPSDQPAPGRGRGLLFGLIGAAILGVGGWQVYTRVIAPPPAPDAHPIAAAPADAKPASDAAPVNAKVDAKVVDEIDAAADAKPVPADAAAPDAKPAPVVPADAAAPDAKPVPADAAAFDAGTTVAVVGAKPPIPVAPPNAGPADSLAIASTPPGAHIFLDGADAGATPAKLAGSPDRHNLALLLPGHELYLAQVDGHGAFQVTLKEVTPTNGPAGIKVLRCKDKNRYYVFVDGKPSGQLCPTERIGTELGAHTVEVYDAISETRHKWDIVVKDTRLSVRVRVE